MTENMPLLEPLTEREMEAIRLMCKGLTNPEIAEVMVISVETVRWYIRQIYEKLSVHTRTQAVLRAQALGLCDDEQDTQSAKPESPVARNNLPHYSLSFVGREAELAELQSMLQDDGVRLVTISGPGGIGKTRFAVELAHTQLNEFADGVYFVSLSTLTQADELLPAILQAMSLHTSSDPRQALLKYLADRDVLLVLDSLEHLADSPSIIARLLRETSSVKLLITSRSSLNLMGEHVRHLTGTEVPASAEADVSQFSAVKLFVDRAGRVLADFDLDQNRDCVLEICRLVEGMPLAIEIATTWLKSKSCQRIAEEIRHNLDFLSTPAPDVDERHRSIRAVFDYSWKLLNPEECRVLMRLALFRGGFGETAAYQLAGATSQMLANLIDKSLLYQSAPDFYGMHDLLRQYVEQKLTAPAPTQRTTRSSKIAMWSALLQGHFEQAQQFADDIINHRANGQTLYEEAFGMALLGVLSGVNEDYDQCQQLCESAYKLMQQDEKNRDNLTMIFTYVGLAIAACGHHDYQAVQQHTLAALDLAAALQVPAFTTLCLPLIAVVLAHAALPQEAVEMIALAHIHRASTPKWMGKWKLIQDLKQDLRQELGDEAYQQAWQTARDLSTVRIDLQAAKGL